MESGDSSKNSSITRRSFAAAAAAFTIVPRHVLGGQGHTAPSDKITVATIGMGRQGIAITMEMMSRPDVQIVAVCDCNRMSKDYVEYGANALLKSERRLLGPGYETWGEDLASPGEVQISHRFKYSMGAAGREPAQRLVEAFYAAHKPSGRYHGCSAYTDYRQLLEKEKDLDAVYIATPDHWHAPMSIAAMRKHKHVLCQKPMTHSIGEAHRVAQVASEMKVTASITVNNPSTGETTALKQWIADGAIGKVREVHNWSSRPFWPQGFDRWAETEPVPDGLDWDMWLGPAPARPYHKGYNPFLWRGWYDFGCGSFGDMGCYSFAGIFRVLGLTAPVAVECTSSESFEETYPKASLVHLEFPPHEGRDAVRLSWYDGGLMPVRPAGLAAEDETLFKKNAEGIMYVGDKGMIVGGFNGENARVYPNSKEYQAPAHNNQDFDEMHDAGVLQWMAACKGGPVPLASFQSQAPVTEALLLGCLSQRLPWQRFEWDTAARRITNSEAANRYVDLKYRDVYAV